MAAKLAEGSHSISERESDSDSEYASESVSESGMVSSTYDGLEISPLSVPDTPFSSRERLNSDSPLCFSKVKEKQLTNGSMKMRLGCSCFVLHETLFLQLNSKLLRLTWLPGSPLISDKRQ
jgi:hypothetical protein